MYVRVTSGNQLGYYSISSPARESVAKHATKKVSFVRGATATSGLASSLPRRTPETRTQRP
jgi:hypothetical protein